MGKDIEKLIVKFLLNEADFDEQQELERWIANPKNDALFFEYIKTNLVVNEAMGDFDGEKAKRRILNQIRQEKKIIPMYRKPSFIYAVAVSVTILMIVGVWLSKTEVVVQEMTTPIIVNNQIEPGSEKAVLTLESGEKVVLEKGMMYGNEYVDSNGEELIYLSHDKDNSNKATRELVYNQLDIPRGGQFQITLADGTRVWLNSETRLKYPISFAGSRNREVELVHGEAYFEVLSSAKHQGSRFIVHNKNQDIEVFGTEFNVKAYMDEPHVYTTLVEGKVSVVVGMQNLILAPNEQLKLNVQTGQTSIAAVNVKSEIAWREGVYIFRSKSLKTIMQTLSRWYDMEVVFANKDLEEVLFVGSLNKKHNITDVLNDIKNFGVIKNYEINNKTIILK